MEKKEKIKKFIAKNFGMTHLSGYEYLVRACEIYQNIKIMSIIYQNVAEEYNTTALRVERNIRHYRGKIINVEVLNCAISDKFTTKELLSAINYSVENIKEE